MTAFEQGQAAGKKWVLGLQGEEGRRMLADLEAWPIGCRRAGRSPWVRPAMLATLLTTGQPATDPEAARTFWLGALGEAGIGRERDPQFLEGFVKEALRLWSQLKRHMKRKIEEQKRS